MTSVEHGFPYRDTCMTFTLTLGAGGSENREGGGRGGGGGRRGKGGRGRRAGEEGGEESGREKGGGGGRRGQSKPPTWISTGPEVIPEVHLGRTTTLQVGYSDNSKTHS